MTPAELIRAIAATPPGGTLTLPAGNHGDVSLRKPITLRGEPGAVVRSVAINGEGITVEGLAVQMVPTLASASFASAVRVYQSRDVALRDLTIRGGLALKGTDPNADPSLRRTDEDVIGWPTGRAVTVDRSYGVTLEGLDISAIHKGIVLSWVDGLTVRGNVVHDLRGSPVTGGAVTRATFEGNTFRDLFPWALGGNGDHNDFLHLWTVTGQPVSEAIVIRDNLIDQGKGSPTLGIFLEDNGGAGFSGVDIAGNTLIGGAAQGMRLENVAGRVLDNVLVQASGTVKQAPGIYALQGSVVEVRGNVSADVFGTFKLNPGNTTIPSGVQPEWVLEMARKRHA